MTATDARGKRWAALGARCSIGLLFALASISKALDFDGFIDTLERAHGFPIVLSDVLGCLVVVIEASLAALVLTPAWRFGLAAAAVLLVVFTGALFVAGDASRCGCIQGLAPVPVWAHAAFNLTFAVVAGVAATTSDGLRAVRTPNREA